MSGDKETPKDAVKDEAQDNLEQEAQSSEAPASSGIADDVSDEPSLDPEMSGNLTEDDESGDDADADISDEADTDVSAEVDESEDLDAEITEEPQVERVTEAAAPVAPVVKRGGIVPMVLGGAICLALGYAGAQFIKPSGWPFPGSNTEELSQQIAALESQLAALQDQSETAIAQLATDQTSANETLRADLEGQIAAVDPGSALATLQDQISGFEERMTEIEARPVASAIVSPEATAAYERQLAQMQDLLDSEIARLETAKEQAVAEETEARIATNKARLQAQVDGGEPFAAVLADIGADAPAVLADAAAEGIPSVSVLEEGYAEAARAALVSASRAAYDAGEQGWFQTALRTQLGLRSTTPKEGDGPDAVLSRAEQFVRDGQFAKAITTLESLPEAGKAEMQGWIAQAQTRVDVMTALDEFLGQ